MNIRKYFRVGRTGGGGSVSAPQYVEKIETNPFPSEYILLVCTAK